MAFCLQSCLNILGFFPSLKFGTKSYWSRCVTKLYLLLGKHGEGKLGESFLFPISSKHNIFASKTKII